MRVWRRVGPSANEPAWRSAVRAVRTDGAGVCAAAAAGVRRFRGAAAAVGWVVLRGADAEQRSAGDRLAVRAGRGSVHAAERGGAGGARGAGVGADLGCAGG